MDATTFSALADGVPSLMMSALMGDQEDMAMFLEDSDEPLDGDEILRLAAEATSMSSDEAVRIGGEKALDAAAAEGWQWPDGSALVLLFETDQDPTEALVIELA